MTKKNNTNFENVSNLKKIIVVVSLFTILFGGMFSAIVAIHSFKNYNNPYIFGFTFGMIGLLIGIFIATKIKPYVLLNSIMQSNYSNFKFIFALGFIGHFLLVGFYLNDSLSTLNDCKRYIVINKEYRKGGRRQPELHVLILKIKGENCRLLSKPDYWKSILIGQEITVCDYKSRIGFDSKKLPNDY